MGISMIFEWIELLCTLPVWFVYGMSGNVSTTTTTSTILSTAKRQSSSNAVFCDRNATRVDDFDFVWWVANQAGHKINYNSNWFHHFLNSTGFQLGCFGRNLFVRWTEIIHSRFARTRSYCRGRKSLHPKECCRRYRNDLHLKNASRRNHRLCSAACVSLMKIHLITLF